MPLPERRGGGRRASGRPSGGDARARGQQARRQGEERNERRGRREGEGAEGTQGEQEGTSRREARDKNSKRRGRRGRDEAGGQASQESNRSARTPRRAGRHISGSVHVGRRTPPGGSHNQHVSPTAQVDQAHGGPCAEPCSEGPAVTTREGVEAGAEAAAGIMDAPTLPSVVSWPRMRSTRPGGKERKASSVSS